MKWKGVEMCIQDNMLTPGIKQRAMAFAAEFRKKNRQDPFSYPLNWLIRNLLLNEFSITAVTPVGPKTRAHAVRMAEAQEMAELDSLDIQDDMR